MSKVKTNPAFIKTTIEAVQNCTELPQMRKDTNIKCLNEHVAHSCVSQIKWERDLAIRQLHELGYQLGEAIREEDRRCN